MATTLETYSKLYNAITTGRPFVYSRYGDGDFEIMLERGPDGQQGMNPELALELQECFLHQAPTHLVALAMHDAEPKMCPGMFDVGNEQWLNPIYLDWVNEHASGRYFENAVALHYYAVFKPREFKNFLFQLRKLDKVFVGNTERAKVEAVMGPLTHYVPTEYTDAYDGIGYWWPEIDAVTDKPCMVVAAVGMSTRAVNRRLMLKGFEGQVLDFGSVIDFLVGNENRTWIHLAGKGARRRVVSSGF